MGFLRLFLRGIALLPSLIQGIEGMFGEKAGAQKKQAALEIVGAAINVADAIEGRQIADSAAFTDGLGKIIDGVVECLNASAWHKT
jgi:hypothetical protein